MEGVEQSIGGNVNIDYVPSTDSTAKVNIAVTYPKVTPLPSRISMEMISNASSQEFAPVQIHSSDNEIAQPSAPEVEENNQSVEDTERIEAIKEDAVMLTREAQSKNVVFRFLSTLYLAIVYVLRDLRKHKRGYIVGFVSIAMVVTVLVTLQSAMGGMPLLLLKIAEEQLGETDFLLTPNPTNTSQTLFLLNSTFIEEKIRGAPNIRGGSPRWMFPVNMANVAPDEGESSSSVSGMSVEPEPGFYNIAPSLVIALDLYKEDQIGMGRAWPKEYNILGEDEVIVTEGIASLLDRNEGEDIQMVVFINDIVNIFLDSGGQRRITQELTIGDIMSLFSLQDADILDFEPITVTQEINVTLTELINVTILNAGVAGDVPINTILNVTFLEELFNISIPFNATNMTVNEFVQQTFLDTFSQPLAQGDIVYVIGPDTINVYFDPINGTRLEIAETNATDGFIEEYYYALTNSSVNIPSFNRTVAIRRIVSSSYGKWASALGNTVLLNYTYILPYIIDYVENFNWTTIIDDVINQTFANASALELGLNQTVGQALNLTAVDLIFNTTLEELLGNATNLEELVREQLTLVIYDFVENQTEILLDFLRNVTIEDYVLIEGVMSDMDWRMDALLGDSKHIGEKKLELSDVIIPPLTDEMDPTKTAPLFDTMSGMAFILLFLQTLFLLIFAIMLFVGCLVIYSLLVDDVEAKTYEYGMLRALGMRQRTLIIILFVQSFFFAIPATIVGIILAFVINAAINVYLSSYTSTPIDLIPDGFAVATGLLAGLLMPIAGNILPIRRALSSTLRESLDISHGFGTKGSKVSMVNLSDISVDPWQLFFSIVAVVMAIVVYYLIPYTLLSNMLEQFFQLLTGVLLAMFIGLSTASIVLTPIVEKLVPWFSLWWKERKILPLVANNLSAHAKRNRMTSTLFIFSVAYLLFSGIFILQTASNVEALISSLTGSDIVLSTLQDPASSSAFNGESEGAFFGEGGVEVTYIFGLPRKEMTEFLNNDYRVAGYSFITFPLSNFERYRGAEIGNILGGSYSGTADVVGIESTYLGSAFDQYAIVTELNPLVDSSELISRTKTGEFDVAKSLYDNAGTIGGQSIGQEYYAPLLVNGINIDEISLGTEIKQSYLEYLDVIVSEGIRDIGSVDTSSSLGLEIETIDSSARKTKHFHIARAHGMVSKFPGFSFSEYSIFSYSSYVLVSFDDYLRLLQDDSEPVLAPNADTDLIPVQKCMVRLKEGVSEREIDFLLNNLVAVGDDVFALNMRTVMAVLDDAVFMLLNLFNVISVIGLIMCFFSLWMSFAANVRENSWEFGVLRAVGCSSFRIFRIYIYEAVIVVLVALVFGTGIGIMVAISLTLQFNIFLENRFTFLFPTTLYIIIVVASLITAVLGSFLPAEMLRRKGITRVLRGET